MQICRLVGERRVRGGNVVGGGEEEEEEDDDEEEREGGRGGTLTIVGILGVMRGGAGGQ